MANSPQARKRDRQAKKHRLHNQSQESEMRTGIKKVLRAIADKNLEAAKVALKSVTVLLDRLADRNIIHKNKAARMKSRLNARVKAAA